MAAILNASAVREIRSLYLKGDWSFTELAKKFSVTKPAVQSILTGNNWPELFAEGEIEALRKMRMDRQNLPTKHRR
jgi:predicted DNA-binding protein YlxM (UPF0122 family)